MQRSVITMQQVTEWRFSSSGAMFVSSIQFCSVLCFCSQVFGVV